MSTNSTTNSRNTQTKVTAGSRLDTKSIAFIAMLGALSAVLMAINFSLPFAPSFLKLDIAEMPALFAGFFMGPLPGFAVIVIKLLLKIVVQGSETAFVGEFSNLVGSTVFVVTAALIYKFNRTRKGAIISLVVSTIAVSVVYIFLNAWVMFPLYSKLYGMPMEAIVGMGTAVNPRITSVTTLMLYSVFPFNLLKHGVTDIITYLLYKRVGRVLRGLLYKGSREEAAA